MSCLSSKSIAMDSQSGNAKDNQSYNALVTEFCANYSKKHSPETNSKTSKFSEIPREAVANETETYRILYQILKNTDNRPIIDALMKKANELAEKQDANLFKVHAYRRAAILIARAEKSLMNRETTYNSILNLGFPNNGGTTMFIWDFINDTLFHNEITANPLLAWPTSWYKNTLDMTDPRVKISLYVIDHRLNMPMVFNGEWTEMTRAYLHRVHNEQHTKAAHYYYGNMTINQLKMCRDHIEKMVNAR
jgi:hypothetical protein